MRIEELYGPSIGTETPRGLKTLICRLDALLPGIRLRERLLALPKLSHQTIADFLGDNGHLNERILSILRTSEIRDLSLSSSLTDEEGLNIMSSNSLSVFGKHNSFLFLSYLDFGDVPLEDDQIMHIHHLPRLSRLILDNTGVSNEAMYHLVPLKRSLRFLSVSTNTKITNDSIFALTTLSRLEFLNIFDTEIDIKGVRQFARRLVEQDRITDLVLPLECEEYFDDIRSRYLVEPTPPLITEPELCGRLSAAALKRNLVAHAAVNRSIVASGTKAEMAERLRNLLTIRQDDLLIQERCT
ncbi:hypothetical protein BDN72DRAFT_927378 [Pluteus cervinus]|uniref:Uncharacterized protein n=1 Tax=Pluteus cervinus TaxID=181527 RepID=A0ACD3ADS4_9AGAR|nr:hypothetical protein BDN72DRAFT_927378 [Pluteus cervinus]